MVFDTRNSKHPHFRPVLEWVAFGAGRMIYGGTKYKAELRQAYRFLGIVAELQKSRRAIEMPLAQVDEIAERIRERAGDPEFNDEHIAALVVVSRCCVVCTIDDHAIAHLKRPELFSHYKLRRPRIYRSKRNSSLCCNQHLVEICKRVGGG